MRVVQIQETDEESIVCKGTTKQCDDWIEANAASYPESTFYILGDKEPLPSAEDFYEE